MEELLKLSDYKLKKIYKETTDEKLKSDVRFILKYERGIKVK